ncbi:MAG TPA: acetyl-CoA carboxylase biotin carboxyl carrier protein [Pyrinomonadaceae bacterium]|nr:acetyl-CoA carboxylase biotin carboxyl carrier protein [Pyrinomonadaceae bacterium]
MSEQATQQQPSPDEQPQESRAEQQQRQGRGERGPRRRRGHGQPQQQQQSGQSRRPDPSLNMDELRDLVQLIAEHGFTDFELEREGFRVRLRRELTPQIISAPSGAHAAQPQVSAATTSAPAAAEAQTATASPAQGAQQSHAQPKHPGAEAEAAASADEGLHIITSPIVGTFYRSPSPTADPFVRIGSHVEPDTNVCIIEAMKLMNEIQAETAGEVVKIYVENGQPVEYGQPLFGIKQ